VLPPGFCDASSRCQSRPRPTRRGYLSCQPLIVLHRQIRLQWAAGRALGPFLVVEVPVGALFPAVERLEGPVACECVSLVGEVKLGAVRSSWLEFGEDTGGVDPVVFGGGHAVGEDPEAGCVDDPVCGDGGLSVS
jgi:hypothetical protein